MSGKKYNIYIQAKHLKRWERKPKYSRSTWVNEQLQRELDTEHKEPVWLKDEQRWSDSDPTS